MDEMELVARARHRDVEQPALLLDFLRTSGGHVGRNTSVDNVQNIDHIPLLPFGRVDRRENQVVVVNQRIAREIARRFRGIERQVAEEALARGMILCEVLEHLEIRYSDRRGFVQPLEMRLIPLANDAQLARPLRGFPQHLQQAAERRRNLTAAQDAAGMGRPDPRQELQHPEPRDVVARILGPPEKADDVLYVRRFDELEAAVLHKWDVAPAELDFEQIGVVGRPHEHRLAVQQHAGFAGGEHPLYYIVRLRLLILHRDEQRPLLRLAVGEEVLADDRIGGIQNRLHGPIVLLELQDSRGRIELIREVENITDRRATKSVDCLPIISYHRDRLAELQDDLGLERVGVLIFVDENMVKRYRRDVHRKAPIQE